MKNKLNSSVAAIAAGMLLLGMTLLAFAQTSSINVGVDASVSTTVVGGVHAKMGAALTARINNLQTRADQEITRRINALNALSSRVNQMQKISSDDKTSLSASIQSQITAMTNLQTQIGADAAAESTSSLITDVKSITGSYRIFALIIPQGTIEAAADRVLDVASSMNALSAAFSTRVSDAQSAGANVTAVTAMLADFNAKISDANTQAQAAVAEVAALTPDNGVQAQMEANTTALKDARSKIQLSQQDLIGARTDAQTIIKSLQTFEAIGHAGISASTTVSASASSLTSTSPQ